MVEWWSVLCICLFSKTQLEDKEFVKMKLQLEQFLENLVDQETGFYFKGSQPKTRN